MLLFVSVKTAAYINLSTFETEITIALHDFRFPPFRGLVFRGLKTASIPSITEEKVFGASTCTIVDTGTVCFCKSSM